MACEKQRLPVEMKAFISYRRSDAGYAGRLAEHLTRHFGQDRVCLDVVSLVAGANFAANIDAKGALVFGVCGSYRK